MSLKAPIFGTAILTVALATSAFAGKTVIEGRVRDSNGKPLSGAEVRLESKDKGAVSATVKTDAKGDYNSGSLTPNKTYKVSLFVGGQVKAQIANVAAKGGEANKLNFDLKKGSQAAGKTGAKRYVYVPGQTGSHMGGRWVEVNDDGTSAANADGVKRTGAGAISSMQQNSFNRGGN